MEDPFEQQCETFVFTAMHEGHNQNYSEMTTKSIAAAFKEYPTALHAHSPLRSSIYVNRDGEPAPMTLVKVRVQVPYASE